MLNDIPYTKELDPYVDGECSLELHAQLETLLVVPRVHCIREWQLFEIARREKPDFLKHTGKGTGCESTTRETEDANLISNVI